LTVLGYLVECGKEVFFTGSGNHFSLKYFFTEFESHFLGQFSHEPDVHTVFMHDFFDAFTVNKKNSSIVKHFSQDLNVLFLEGFTCVCKLQLTTGVLFVSNFGEDSVGEFIFPSENNLGPQITTAFHDIAVDKEGPEFSDIDEVVLRILRIDRAVFGVKNRFGVDEFENTLVFEFSDYSMQFDSQAEWNREDLSFFGHHLEVF
jgi:hypothetical protein